MLLQKILEYENIAIQCHNTPDADTIAAGFALYMYCKAHHKKPLLFYKGDVITKPNLLAMMVELQIPITHEPHLHVWDGILVTVDCQYGMRNVTRVEAQQVAVIDHHIQEADLPELCDLRPWLGSCSTLIWDLLSRADFTFDKNVATALHYGLLMDTNGFSELKHPLDKDMWNSLVVDEDIIKMLRLSNLSWEDLIKTSSSLKDLIKIHDDFPVVIIPVPSCDANLLGVIADLVIQVDKISAVVAYTALESKDWKLSVRTTTRDTIAPHVAAWLTDGIGGGGGHMEKAGGTVSHTKYMQRFGHKPFDSYCKERLEAYYKLHRIIDCASLDPLQHWPDVSRCKIYRKLPTIQAFIELEKVFGLGTEIDVRTLEGDISVTCQEDNYLLLGIEAEVYPIKRDVFEKTFIIGDFIYAPYGTYHPTIVNKNTGKRVSLREYAQCCQSKPKQIQAFCLEESEYVKIFTSWNKEGYYSGKPGDFVAVQSSHDVYVIQADIFARTYARDFSKEEVSTLPQAQAIAAKEAYEGALYGWAVQAQENFCVDGRVHSQEGVTYYGKSMNWLIQNVQGEYEILSHDVFMQKYMFQ